MEQYDRDHAECDWWEQQLPRHGRLRFEGGQHLLRLIHWEAQPLGNVLDLQGVPFRLRQVSGPLYLRAEVGEEACRHLPGLDGVGDAMEEPGFENRHGVLPLTVHEGAPSGAA